MMEERSHHAADKVFQFLASFFDESSSFVKMSDWTRKSVFSTEKFKKCMSVRRKVRG